MKPRSAMIAALLVAGCANGPIYWTRAGATEDVFLTDHTPCFKTATIGYGVGNEQGYKACMQSKGWTRISGTGSQHPKAPHFRGPEGDDDFSTIAERCDRWRARPDRADHPPPSVECLR